MGGLFTWKYEGKDSGQDFICVEILMQGSIWKKKGGLNRGLLCGQGFIFMETSRNIFFLKWS